MNVLVIDVGGTHVKILATGQKVERRMESGPTLDRRADGGRRARAGEGLEVRRGVDRLSGPRCAQPAGQGTVQSRQGWVDLDYEAAFGCPVKIVNDAAMQALGSYKGGKMLFLGFGTGLGIHADRRRRHRADGARAPAVQEGHVRGLCRRARVSIAWARRSGASTSTDVIARLSPRSSRMTWCWAAATRRTSRNCRRCAGSATTPMPLPAGSACGKSAPRPGPRARKAARSR